MDQKNRRSYQKIVVLVLAICICVSGLLLFQISSARYRSQMSSTAEYKPALFNTVLLGNLPFMKVQNPAYPDDPNMTLPVEQGGKLSASIKVDTSMDFGAIQKSDANGTGGSTDDADGFKSGERRLRPGSVVAIPFTVTNGTTLETYKEDGTVDIASNLAGTDIAYTLQIITTTNIPLEYDVYEYATEEQFESLKGVSDDGFNYEDYLEARNHYVGKTWEPEDCYKTDHFTTAQQKTVSINWGTLLSQEKHDITFSELVGYSRSRTIYPRGHKATDSGAGEEDYSKFILNAATDDNGNDVISVNRYMLVVYWPDLAYETNAAGEIIKENGSDKVDQNGTNELRDTKYMKEIDIIEVRLAVESWVKAEADDGTPNDGEVTPILGEPSKAILRIQTLPQKADGMYDLPADDENKTEGYPTNGNVYSMATVPFYATRPLINQTDTTEDATEESTEPTSSGTTESTPSDETETPTAAPADVITSQYFDFIISNATEVGYQWDETSQTYKPVGSHAFANGSVAIAVPVQKLMGTAYDYTDLEQFTYEIHYDDIVYTAKLTHDIYQPTNQFMTTQVWQEKLEGDKDEPEKGVDDTYKEYPRDAYQILTFVGAFRDAHGQPMEGPLVLDPYAAGTAANQQLRLIVRAKTPAGTEISYDHTDHFKIIVFQGPGSDQGNQGSQGN